MVDKREEIINILDIHPKPLEEDGWLTFSYILAGITDVKEKALRDRLNQKVSDNEMEKCQWGKNAYYRIKPKV